MIARVSSTDLQTAAQNDPEFAQRMREDPEAYLRSLGHPLNVDKWVYRIVVLFLGATIMAVVIGGIYISAQTIVSGTAVAQKEFPAALVAIGSAATGAIAGMLAPSPRE